MYLNYSKTRGAWEIYRFSSGAGKTIIPNPPMFENGIGARGLTENRCGALRLGFQAPQHGCYNLIGGGFDGFVGHIYCGKTTPPINFAGVL